VPRLKKTLKVNHKAHDLYELVRDIRRYPEFIKWIQSLSVTDERSEDGLYKCTGSAEVGFKGFIESFATDVTGDPDNRQINVALRRGPFRHLRNQWKFVEIAENRSSIEFFIDYEFRNPILRLLAKSNTEMAVDRIMSAFMAEADRRYR